jgi:hypothetical protein
MKTEFGKYLLDVSKLVLGGAVLSTILDFQGMEKLVIILVGFLVSVILLVVGLFVLKSKK